MVVFARTGAFKLYSTAHTSVPEVHTCPFRGVVGLAIIAEGAVSHLDVFILYAAIHIEGTA